MSDIDLKALREAANRSVAAWSASGARDIGDEISLDAGAMLALLDRLESAERRAEEAERSRQQESAAVDAMVEAMGESNEEIDRLQKLLISAREMATKHGEVLQLAGSAVGMPAGSSLHTELMPVVHAQCKDAARYRWLRDRNDWGHEPTICESDGTIWRLTAYTPVSVVDPTDDENLDRGIDAAMAQEGGK